MQQDVLLTQIATQQGDGLKYFDIDLSNGDLQFSNSDNQVITDILQSFVGFFKTDFINGIGLIQYVNSNISFNVLKNIINNALIRDNFSVNSINFVNNEMQINAERL